MNSAGSDLLAIFDERQRQYLLRRAEERGATVEEELRKLVARQMEEADSDALDNLVGMCRGDGSVTGETFHEYLYGREDET